jgi:hypothetical protein
VTEASKQDASSCNTTTNAVALWIIRGAAAADARLVLSQLLSRLTSRDTARPTISRSAAQFDHHLVAALVITSSYTSRSGLGRLLLRHLCCRLAAQSPYPSFSLPVRSLPPSPASDSTSLKAAGEICHSWAYQGSPILATVIQTPPAISKHMIFDHNSSSSSTDPRLATRISSSCKVELLLQVYDPAAIQEAVSLHHE